MEASLTDSSYLSRHEVFGEKLFCVDWDNGEILSERGERVKGVIVKEEGKGNGVINGEEGGMGGLGGGFGGVC